MKTEEEVRKEIDGLHKDYYHVLYEGGLATVDINAPRALMQLDVITRLKTLHWFLGEKYTHKYKEGVNQ